MSGIVVRAWFVGRSSDPLRSHSAFDIATLGTFSRLIPISKAYNTRIILVNRRDYPGTIPYDEEDLKILQSCLAPPEDEIGIRREKLLDFTKERGGELYDFLNQLILDAELPVAQKEKNTGGIIVVGWSFGAVWMLALLAYVSSLPADNEALGKCIRRIVCHGNHPQFLRRNLSTTTDKFWPRNRSRSPSPRIYGPRCPRSLQPRSRSLHPEGVKGRCLQRLDH